MHMVIMGARELHGCKSLEEYRTKHQLFVARQQAHGKRIAVHESEPLPAYINHGYWVADCECGAGVGTDPEWGEGRCYSCGAIHETTFPRHRERIEEVLLKRPQTINRNWTDERLSDLRAENAERGI